MDNLSVHTRFRAIQSRLGNFSIQNRAKHRKKIRKTLPKSDITSRQRFTTEIKFQTSIVPVHGVQKPKEQQTHHNQTGRQRRSSCNHKPP